MNTLNINTGVKTYSLNDKISISFNPTDALFAGRIFSALSDLEAKQNEYAEKGKATTGAVAFFETAKIYDKQMREIIDAAFNAPVSDAMYGNECVFAFADGAPVWVWLFLAIIDVIDEKLRMAEQEKNPALEKHLAKYRHV